jgi:hypothetical protein
MAAEKAGMEGEEVEEAEAAAAEMAEVAALAPAGSLPAPSPPQISAQAMHRSATVAIEALHSK